jgi:uncharacterized protein
MRAIRAALLAALAVELVSGASVRVLLIDGPEWQPRTAALKAILEASDILHVDVLTAPAKGNAFEPPFDKYKAVVLNYGGDDWPLSTLAALDKYLQGGGGLVVLPAADAAFPAWTAYNQLLGVSGAPNRDQSAGPILFYQQGNIASDGDTKGPAGQAPHPDQPFAVTIRNTEHPITKGVPLVWMHTADTLAGNLRGPGKNMLLLATAHSDMERGGTGRDEPVMLAVTYGKGRVFHILLGRTPEGVACVGFQTMLSRGAEWAATSKVTTKMPSDFPTEEKTSTRPVKSAP